MKRSIPPLRAAVIVVLACSLALAAVRAADPVRPPSAAAPAVAPPIDPANFDRSINPGDDFYHYADGTWLKTHPIPAEQTSWGAFDEIDEHNHDVLHAILEECAAAAAKGGPDAAPGSIRQKVGDFYASGMDEAAIEVSGTKPLARYLDHIDELRGLGGLPGEIAEMHLMGIFPLFQPVVEADEKNSDLDIAQLYQGGLSLPERDYYLKEDEASRKLRAAYQAHVGRMFALLGDSAEQAQLEAASVMRLETALAQASKTPVALRDPQSNYHKMTVDKLVGAAPGFDWHGYFAALGVPNPGEIDAKQTEFLAGAAQIAGTYPLEDWKSYLRWHLIHSTAPYLTKPFVDENFSFFGTTLTGAAQIRPRWKRVMRTTDDSLGEALGQLYVAKAFPPEAKARALTMIGDLRASLRERLSNLDWMGPQTRTEALKKLDLIGVKVGYPDHWRSYAALDVTRRPFVDNVIAANRFEVKRQFAKIGGPVDRDEWGMTPPTVNAYYDPSRNEIVFPAGILQPPFFSAAADDAVNYGGIGAIIGHEMTHGFDDQGRQYDPGGNLRDWWTADDAQRFKERSARIIAQFNAYEPQPGLHVNGELTQGENIADLGGVKLGFAALHRALDRSEAAARTRKIDGFTPEQRYFLSWAQVWRTNMRPETERMYLNVNPHAPAQYRVNGPCSNLVEFQKAFALPDSAPLVRPENERVQIW